MNIYIELLPLTINHLQLARYCKFISYCKTRNNNRNIHHGELHHILPRSLFPDYTNQTENLIKLTYREHFIAHWILAKAIGKCMNDAFWMMCSCQNNGKHSRKYKISSRTYSLYRNKISIKTRNRMKGMVTTKDNLGNIHFVSVNDPRFLSGEFIALSKGQIVVKDKDGNNMRISKDDPRFLSGELTHVAKGNKVPPVNKNMVVVKDKYENIMRVSKDDPRYLSGELVGVMNGRKHTSIRKRVICPYCNKEGAVNTMYRWHFDNCKQKFTVIE